MTTRPSTLSIITLFLLLTGLWALTGCDQSSMNETESTTYTASLSSLNSSGVNGEYKATLPVACGTLSLRQGEG